MCTKQNIEFIIFSKIKTYKVPQHSTHIDDIIGKKPNWLIRFGISGILLMLLTLLFVSWLVKYPDVIKAEVFISTPNPPIDLVCPINAQIEKIFEYSADSIVKKDSPLILLKNSASYHEIKKLKDYLNVLSKDSLLNSPIISSKNFHRLGDLQSTYNQLSTYLEEFNEHLKHTPFKNQILFLEKIISNNKESLQISERRFLIELQDHKIVIKAENRADILFNKGVIAQVEYELEKQKLLRKEIQLESYRAGLIDQKTIIVNLQKQLAELIIQKDHFYHEIRRNIKNITKLLNSQIEVWVNNFVISSPINGAISVFKEFNTGDFLTAGSYVLTILPLEDQELFAYGSFSVEKAGKLQVNNKTIIKLHSFPYREYGSIDGYIDKISDFPIKNMYSVKIRLPSKLKTGFDKKITFKQRLSGQAELITENRSLLSRIFSNFKYFVEMRIKE